MKVLISQRAEEDLARIYAYLASRHPGAAEGFRIEVDKALASLGRNPELGPCPAENRVSPAFVFGSSAASTTT